MYKNILFGFLIVISEVGWGQSVKTNIRKTEKIEKGIWKISFGKPEAFNFLSVADHKPLSTSLEKLGDAKLPFSSSGIRITRVGNKSYIQIPLQKQEQLYGLGLNFKTVNIRGHLFRLHMDHYGNEDNGRDHAPVPFFVSSLGYGVFINSARYLDVYAGSSVRMDSKNPPPAIDRIADEANWKEYPYSDNIEILVPAAGVELYVFAGPTAMNAVQRFNLFFGGGVLPPKWGLGFWFRPWYMENAAGAIEIAKQFEANRFPLDVLGLEPGWQSKAYPCSYEWRKSLFADPAQFVQELLANNVRTNLWFNPYVSPEAPIDPLLKPYYGSHTVWVGAIPDYTISAARKIFRQYLEKNLLDIGISGFKIDEVDGYDRWLWPDAATFPSGRDGEQMRQTYGLQMMLLSDELFRKRNQRTYGLIRAENAGAAGHPYVMYNDHYNHREYITALINSGFCGVLWTPEVRAAASAEDWTRRMQTVCFSPMAMINGFADSLLPWTFKELRQAVLDVALLRMQLLPYIYSSFAQYHFEGKPVFRPLNLVDSFDYTGEIKDEYMMGDFILVAPLFAGETSRKVILPKGNWYDFYTGSYAGNGETITISPRLEKIPLFVCEGGIIPMIPPIRQTAEWKQLPLTIRVYGKSPCLSGLYDDDGITFNYEKGKYSYKKLIIENITGNLTGKMVPVKEDGGWSYTTIDWEFMTK